MAEIKVGTVVYSLAGHDKGSAFAVTKLEGDFAYIADGAQRKLENPKKKRIKHLQFTNTSLDMTKVITDKELRRIFSAKREREVIQR
ncbi:MAG: KOW domain-containing RNA-binding protein [Ruminococcus sp.]|jgi:ribosomal protein L14E/L6E/L27E|nr:KOW domain-containing RNA-binding protein [Ruminococcus sp.]